MLFLILVRLFKCKTAAFLAALVWSVHPLRVESVVWIASRKDVLSTFFLLAALLAWLKAGKSNVCWLMTTACLLILGAMAKPSVMVFPAFAFTLDFLITKERKVPGVYWALIGYSVVVAWEASSFQRIGDACSLGDLIPLGYRLLNAFSALTIYLGNIFWPDALAMQCMIRYPDPPKFSILGCVILLLLVLWTLWIVLPRVRRFLANRDYERFLKGGATENSILAGLAIFFGCLVPYLGISSFGFHAFADRFTIVPAIGLTIALTALLVRFPLKGFSVALVAFGCLLFGVKTIRQTELWRDDVTLMKNTLAVDRDNNVSAHRGLAVCAWDGERNMEEVYTHLKKAYDYAWCEHVRDGAAVSAQMLIEACYETGRLKEAEDFYLWFRKVSFKYNGSSPSVELLYADALDAIYSKRNDRIREAEEILKRIESISENSYLAATLNYLIARATGDEDRIRSALVRCSQVDERIDYCCCRWAKRLLTADRK